MLETSKTFTKQVCDACGAPTAKYASFDDAEAAKTYIRAEGAPIVVKADGLAAGKGVVVASSEDEALEAVDRIFDGPGGGSVVIEEMMEGEEASFFVLTDGTNIIPLAGAQDHKRARDGDRGPNTGGMGAYSPAPAFTPELQARATEEIAKPILAEMAKRGTPYSGVLYVGLMLTDEGPKLVEINARFGDPECHSPSSWPQRAIRGHMRKTPSSGSSNARTTLRASRSFMPEPGWRRRFSSPPEGACWALLHWAAM